MSEVAVFAEEATQEFVVVAWDVNETGSLAAFAQDFLDHVIVASAASSGCGAGSKRR